MSTNVQCSAGYVIKDGRCVKKGSMLGTAAKVVGGAAAIGAVGTAGLAVRGRHLNKTDKDLKSANRSQAVADTARARAENEKDFEKSMKLGMKSAESQQRADAKQKSFSSKANIIDHSANNLYTAVKRIKRGAEAIKRVKKDK